MIRRLMLLVIILAAGFAPLAQAVPCIMGDHTQMGAGGDGCMTMPHHYKGADNDCAKTSVQDCFGLHALAPETTTKAIVLQEVQTAAILPVVVTPAALRGQNVVRPPPQTVERFTPTHQFLSSLSRWLV